jgi:2'-5' RNA ligase
LARAVGERLAPLGHPPEARPYHAHLTLARLKVPAGVRLPAVTSVGQPWRVDAVTVYESVLRRSGAEYLPRSVIPMPDA